MQDIHVSQICKIGYFHYIFHGNLSTKILILIIDPHKKSNLALQQYKTVITLCSQLLSYGVQHNYPTICIALTSMITLMALTLVTSLSPYFCSTWRVACPKVHRPCRIGVLKPENNSNCCTFIDDRILNWSKYYTIVNFL